MGEQSAVDQLQDQKPAEQAEGRRLAIARACRADVRTDTMKADNLDRKLASVRRHAYAWAAPLVAGILLSIGSWSPWGNASAEPAHDHLRYQRIKEIINSSTNHLLGLSLDDATALLALQGVPWSKGYTNYPNGEARIYHFQGFCLFLHLQLLPPGVTPSTKEYAFTLEGLQRNGVRWLAAFDPFVRVDGLTNSAQRMTDYWSGVSAGFAEKAKNTQ